MLLTPRLNGRFVLRFRPTLSIGRLLFAFEDDENLKVIENRLEFCWPERLSLFMVLYSPAQSEFVAVQGVDSLASSVLLRIFVCFDPSKHLQLQILALGYRLEINLLGALLWSEPVLRLLLDIEALDADHDLFLVERDGGLAEVFLFEETNLAEYIPAVKLGGGDPPLAEAQLGIVIAGLRRTVRAQGSHDRSGYDQ